MDIVNAASSRAAFYDRGAEPQIIQYASSGHVPHGATVRATYTVPASRKTIVNSIELMVIRKTAPAPAGAPQGWVSYTPDGGVAQVMALSALITATVGERSSIVIGTEFVMYPGDEITLNTADNSTGGTVFYGLYILMTEFDY